MVGLDLSMHYSMGMWRRLIVLFFLLDSGYSQEWRGEVEGYNASLNPILEEELIDDLRVNPLNVNGNLGTLIELGILNSYDTAAIRTYRLLYGDIHSYAELRLVDAALHQKLNDVKEFITFDVSKRQTKSAFTLRLRNRWLVRGDEIRNSHYLRTRYTSRRVTISLGVDPNTTDGGSALIGGGIEIKLRPAKFLVGYFRPDWGRGLLFTNRYGGGAVRMEDQIYFDRSLSTYTGLISQRMFGAGMVYTKSNYALEAFVSDMGKSALFSEESTKQIVNRTYGMRFVRKGHNSSFFIGYAGQEVGDDENYINSGWAHVSRLFDVTADLVLSSRGYSGQLAVLVPLTEELKLSIRPWFNKGNVIEHGRLGNHSSYDEDIRGGQIQVEKHGRDVLYGCSYTSEEIEWNEAEPSRYTRIDAWLEWATSREASLLVRVRGRSVQDYLELDQIQPWTLRMRWRAQGTSSRITMNVDLVRSDKTGWLVYEEVKVVRSKLSALFRIYYLAVPSWNERIYIYENDLLYAYANRAFGYEGWRAMALFNLRVSRSSTVECKVAAASYDGQYQLEGGVQYRLRL